MKTNKLKAKMIEKGINHKQVAEALKITYSTANLKINGKYNFTLPEVVHLCNILELDSDERVDIFLSD